MASLRRASCSQRRKVDPEAKWESGMSEDDSPAAGYLKLAERIKEHIRKHGLQVGEWLPERRGLEAEFGETAGIVRQAVDHLKYEGIIRGSQGKRGYEIIRLPGEADPMTADQA